MCQNEATEMENDESQALSACREALADLSVTLHRLFSKEPDEHAFGEAQLKAMLAELVDVLGSFQHAAIEALEAGTEDVHPYAALGAYLEWMVRIGRAASDALQPFGEFFAAKSADTLDRLKNALAALNTELLKFPFFTEDGLARERAERSSSKEDPMNVTGRKVSLSELSSDLGIERDDLIQCIASAGIPIGDQAVRFTDEQARAIRSAWLRHEIHTLIDQPGDWLQMPNPWLGGHSPEELMGSDKEQLVVDIIEGLRHGCIS
jgi:hypothetical protein